MDEGSFRGTLVIVNGDFEGPLTVVVVVAEVALVEVDTGEVALVVGEALLLSAVDVLSDPSFSTVTERFLTALLLGGTWPPPELDDVEELRRGRPGEVVFAGVTAFFFPENLLVRLLLDSSSSLSSLKS